MLGRVLGGDGGARMLTPTCDRCFECGRREEAAAFSIEFCSEVCRDKWMAGVYDHAEDEYVPVDDWETHDLELALDRY